MTDLKLNKEVVGKVDDYEISKDIIILQEILWKLLPKNLTGMIFEFNDMLIQVIRVGSVIGLLVDHNGPRGPITRNVICRIIPKEVDDGKTQTTA